MKTLPSSSWRVFDSVLYAQALSQLPTQKIICREHALHTLAASWRKTATYKVVVAEGRPQNPVPDKVIYDASPLLIYKVTDPRGTLVSLF